MNKSKKIFAILLCLILVFSFAACGSKAEADYDYSGDSEKSADVNYKKISSDNSESTENVSSLAEKALEGKNVKLVYKANLSLQTQDFDESYSVLVSLVEEYKGYFESCEISNGSYYNTYNNQYGNMVVRIPTENYSEFLKKVGDSIYVASQSESVQNIGQKYYETETHIATLKVEISRLQELMKQAADMSDIITIEKALAEAENELEQYQSTLAGYDSLVEYSTITITLSQVRTYTGDQSTFGEKIKEAFAEGWEDFVSFLESFVLWIVESIFGLVLIAIIVFLCIKIKPISKLKAKSAKKKAAKALKAANKSEVNKQEANKQESDKQ